MPFSPSAGLEETNVYGEERKFLSLGKEGSDALTVLRLRLRQLGRGMLFPGGGRLWGSWSVRSASSAG